MTGDPPPRLPDPARPRLPQGRSAGRRSGRTIEEANAATFAALIGLGMLAFGFIAMVALVLPQVRGLIFVFLGAIGFFAAHYVVWGWWLPKLVPQDVVRPEARPPEPILHDITPQDEVVR